MSLAFKGGIVLLVTAATFIIFTVFLLVVMR